MTLNCFRELDPMRIRNPPQFWLFYGLFAKPVNELSDLPMVSCLQAQAKSDKSQGFGGQSPLMPLTKH